MELLAARALALLRSLTDYETANFLDQCCGEPAMHSAMRAVAGRAAFLAGAWPRKRVPGLSTLCSLTAWVSLTGLFVAVYSSSLCVIPAATQERSGVMLHWDVTLQVRLSRLVRCLAYAVAACLRIQSSYGVIYHSSAHQQGTEVCCCGGAGLVLARPPSAICPVKSPGEGQMAVNALQVLLTFLQSTL